MRLNGTLISSFLFVSAVLAGDQLERRQPPFLNHVEKSINSTTFLPIADLAGVFWTASPEERVKTIAGTFTVPSVEGNGGLARFMIMMGISTSACSGITIGAGIIVQVTPNGVIYQSFAHWEEGITAVDPMPISAGDVIRASFVMSSPTLAHVTFRNVGRGQSWSMYIGGPSQPSHCRQDAKWIIAVTRPITLLPVFGPVTIKEMSLKVDEMNEEIVPRRPNILVTNIGHPRVETCAMFYRDQLVIVYLPPPPPG